MQQILHFSDTHDNQRSVEVLFCVASNWKHASVAITGDVCNYKKASSKYDELPNPNIWLVPGNHDIPISHRLGLCRVRWQTPYLLEGSNSIAVGLNSEDVDGVEGQLGVLKEAAQDNDKRVLIVLHHKPFHENLVKALVSRGLCAIPNLRSLVLLHGHDHHAKTFFAEWHTSELDGISVFTSNVYSANTWFGNYGLAGCANLITIHDSGEISNQTVYDPEETSIQDGFVERISYGPRKPGWQFGSPGHKYGPPAFLLQKF